MSYWDVLNQEDALDLLEGGHRLPEDLPGHAQEFETSMALRWFSENVRSQAMQDQKDRSPLLGTREKGEAFTRRIVGGSPTTCMACCWLEKTSHPPFHPTNGLEAASWDASRIGPAAIRKNFLASEHSAGLEE